MAETDFADLDHMTGEPITNFDSARQSVEVIVSTRLMSMPMLREFGGGEVELLGRMVTRNLFGLWKQLVATAIDIWEPRFRVRRVIFDGGVDALRLGQAGIDLEVDYRPLAHLGDFTVERVTNLTLYFMGGRVTASA